MEFKPEDIENFRSQHPLGFSDCFGKLFIGHIPAENSYSLPEMDVAIRVVDRQGEEQEVNHRQQLQNELKLCSDTVKHNNIIGLKGFSETNEKFYLIYEMLEARPLSEVVNVLSWNNMKKVLKGIADGLAFLHNHPQGPFVLSNLTLDNVLVTQDFVPKIIDFRYCIVDGQRCNNPSKQEGSATVTGDISDFGVLALQLITKDTRKAFLKLDDQGISPHHIVDLYEGRFKDGDNLIHASYGKPNVSRNLTIKIFDCLKKNSNITMKDFKDNLIGLMLSKKI